MTTDPTERLTKLQKLFENGLLEQTEYDLLRANLENTVTHQAETQSGAIAQGAGATAVAERGVNVEGNVTGDIITGNVYNGPSTEDPDEALRIYRQVLVASSGTLPLRGVDVGASDPTSGQNPLGLSNVYVDLNTTTQIKVEEKRAKEAGGEEPKTRPLPALEAAVANPNMVLLGDPGSGKSTFVNHLAHCLAAHALEPDVGWLREHLPDWPQEADAFVPIVVILRDWASQLPDQLPKPEPQHLWNFIKARLAMQNLEFAAKVLQSELEAGRALLLLDGLDEVPTAAQRIFVREAILAFKRRYEMDGVSRNRYLATSRILSYQAPQLRLPADLFPIFELAVFSTQQIDDFIQAWYVELVRLGTVKAEKCQPLTRQLQQAVRRPDLWRMASNPLLLTIMALVHAHKGRLPDARALLYEDTVDMLLWRWEQVKLSGAADQTALRELLIEADRTDVDLKRVLGQLAYAAHAQVNSGDAADKLADVGELKLLKALADLNNGDMGWAQKILQVMKLRAGLLVERLPEVFTFPHRTFQEYLAGTHLAVQPDFVKTATTLAEQSAWREVVLLAVGHLVYVLRDPYRPLNLVAELCPTVLDKNPLGWQKVWLAGDVLLEIGIKRVGDSALGRDLLERVRDRLVDLLTSGTLTPRERMQAGDTLAQLGDPRPGVCTLEPDLVPLSAGAFLMGDEKFTVTIKQPFAIGRYPVTNAQYRLFVADGGYTEQWRHCWTDDGWQEREQRGWTEPRLWERAEFAQANQPVVGVSWYEAVAYAQWLAEKTGKPYRLPTEAEWERAARHTDGRIYPWGDDWQDGYANTQELGLDRATAVGMFPVDAAICDVQDMAGNVNEWCQTRWQDKNGKTYEQPYQDGDDREVLVGGRKVWRVIRGGAMIDTHKNWPRCAARDGYDPGHWSYYFGFRVVMSPLSLDAAASDL